MGGSISLLRPESTTNSFATQKYLKIIEIIEKNEKKEEFEKIMREKKKMLDNSIQKKGVDLSDDLIELIMKFTLG